ncbi:Caspase-9-like isoform X5 [Oopsacas minuta]|uniref:Caspase-9-like isoform X5 n=1 Tax=Oopsacas minuta TaxID=111878 RepID=A0AAV7KIB1_9METZ|nr:Caspase-9-like isoform X5 [Oopsacas minuta]
MDRIVQEYQYNIGSAPRGIGLIIVNHFHGQEKSRKGAGNEEENLRLLFTLMGLDTKVFIELNAKQIEGKLLETAAAPRLKTDSMFAVAISSHGCEEGLLGVRGDKDDFISTNQIRNIFNGNNCPNLAKKPKILLLNGCRGNGNEEIIESDNLSTKNIPEQLATTWSDFFTIYSCEFGTVALRSTYGGSIFIEMFLECYKAYGANLPFEMMMPIVNRKLMKTCAAKTRRYHIDDVPATQSCTWESSCTCILKVVPKDAVINKVPAKIQPDVDSFKLVWATCSKGLQGPNQMSGPRGLLITPNGQIYILDSVSRCIWVYSTDGEPMYQDISPKTYKQLVIGNLGLTYCWGMCLRDNFLFVSGTLALIKFSLVGGGLLTHKFHDVPISGMDIDENGIIYACERQSCKILLLDMDLNVLPEKLDLTHTLNPATDRLMDIKVLDDQLYILINMNTYIIQIFDKKGHHQRNLVSSKYLTECLYFAINRTTKTIFAGDIVTNELKAFSADGELMYKIGKHGDKRGNLIEPAGIDLTNDGEVVIVSPSKNKFMLQCFKVPPDM